MSGEAVIGKDAKLFYNSATHATPTWVEVEDAMDVSVDLTKAEADISTRNSKFSLVGAGLKETAFNFGYLHNKGNDTVFDAILDSYVNDTVIEIAAMDQDIATSGAQGLRAGCLVTEMSQGQELNEGVKYDVVAKPTRFVEGAALVDPDWYEVA